MRIITIDREFGSGGRELGKRLADALDIPCYDQEIIEEVAKLHGINPTEVERISESDVRTVYPMTIGRRFYSPHISIKEDIKILVSQQEVMKSLAMRGDCVFVGRCADVILREDSPMNLFVYADQQSRLRRCLKRAREDENEQMILRQMRRIDRDRAQFRELLTDSAWGKTGTYHLCINTSDRDIKPLIPAIAEYTKCWFETQKKE